jgi:acyl carrier protein
MSEIRRKVRAFIVENFLFGDENGVKDDTLFLDEGIIDSTGILEMVSFLEEKFGISVEDEELVPENLGSINNVVAYLQRKLSLTEPTEAQSF